MSPHLRLILSWGFQVTRGKESTCQCRRRRRCGFNPWVGKIPWRRKWQLTSVFLPGKSHGQRSLAATVHGGHKESAMTKHTRTRARAHTHTQHISGKMGYFFPVSQGGIFLHSYRTKASLLGANALQAVLLELSSLPRSRSSFSRPACPRLTPFVLSGYKDHEK